MAALLRNLSERDVRCPVGFTSKGRVGFGDTLAVVIVPLATDLSFYGADDAADGWTDNLQATLAGSLQEYLAPILFDQTL